MTDETTAAKQRTEIAVQLATLQGKIDTVIARMEAGDRQGEQLVALTKDQIRFIAADTGELKAVVRDMGTKIDHQLTTMASKLETSINAVRVDLERQIGITRGELDKQIRETVHPVDQRATTLAEQIDDLRLWRAKVVGIALGCSLVSSSATVGILKLVGGA